VLHGPYQEAEKRQRGRGGNEGGKTEGGGGGGVGIVGRLGMDIPFAKSEGRRERQYE
jgi:hypothetical protein